MLVWWNYSITIQLKYPKFLAKKRDKETEKENVGYQCNFQSSVFSIPSSIILALTLKPFNFATFKFKLLDLMLKVN